MTTVLLTEIGAHADTITIATVTNCDMIAMQKCAPERE